MIKLTASHQSGKIGSVGVIANFNTDAERDAYLAKFPKWVGVKATTLSYPVDGVYRTDPAISFRADFYEKQDNPKNENGAKRVRRFLDLAGEVVYNKCYSNSYDTLEQAIAALPS